MKKEVCLRKQAHTSEDGISSLFYDTYNYILISFLCVRCSR
jgi:hypothetical protein